jgi:hypothetical protein
VQLRGLPTSGADRFQVPGDPILSAISSRPAESLTLFLLAAGATVAAGVLVARLVGGLLRGIGPEGQREAQIWVQATAYGDNESSERAIPAEGAINPPAAPGQPQSWRAPAPSRFPA